MWYIGNVSTVWYIGNVLIVWLLQQWKTIFRENDRVVNIIHVHVRVDVCVDVVRADVRVDVVPC